MNAAEQSRASAWLASNSSHPGLVVIGVPSQVAAGSHSDTHQTPTRMRDILDRFSTFHSEAEIELTGLPVLDEGDWAFADASGAEMHAEIERRTAGLDRSAVHAFVGGDGGITRPLVNGFGLAGMGMLSFDASHGVAESDEEPDGVQVVRGLIQDGLPGNRIAQIGIHGFTNDARDRAFCEEADIAVFPMDTVDLWGIDETVTVALDQLGRACDWIFVDFDFAGFFVFVGPEGRILAFKQLECFRQFFSINRRFGLNGHRDHGLGKRDVLQKNRPLCVANGVTGH